jgi:hypothetical protein
MLKKRRRKSGRNLLFLIFVLALFLRLYGIKHGFPFIFHPDEPTIVRSALGVRFDKNPGHFDWPHLYIYLNYFLYMGVARLRDILVSYDLKELTVSYFPLLWNDRLIFYYLTRVFSALLGALTVIPVYLTGKTLKDTKLGLLSALTFALIPFHVWHSHYSLPDVPMVFFLAWGLYFSSRIFKQNDVGDYMGAGLSFGFAASTKYNGGLSALIVFLAHLIRTLRDDDEEFFEFWSFVNLVVAGLFAVAGFIAGTPYALMDYKTFLRDDGPKGALWQFKNVGSVDFNRHVPKFINELVYKLADDFGYVIFIGFFFVLALLVYRLIKKYYNPVDVALWFLVIPALLLIYYISGFETSRSHYFMIAYPYVAVVFGYFLYFVASKLDRWKYTPFFALTIIMILPFYFSLEGAVRFKNGDTRNILHTWFQQNLTQSDEVVYTDNKIDPVLELNQNPSSKGYDKLGTSLGGYFVFVYDDLDDLGGELRSLEPYRSKLTQVFSVQNTEFLGPNILIFRIQ